MSDSPFEARVSLITLGVADLARARAFYETGLGWKAAPDSQGDVVFFQAGALAIARFPRRSLAEDANVPANGDGFRGITIAHNVREPADVDRLLAIAEAAGATITKPAQDAFWGGRTGYFTDPDGTSGRWLGTRSSSWPRAGCWNCRRLRRRRSPKSFMLSPELPLVEFPDCAYFEAWLGGQPDGAAGAATGG